MTLDDVLSYIVLDEMKLDVGMFRPVVDLKSFNNFYATLIILVYDNTFADLFLKIC